MWVLQANIHSMKKRTIDIDELGNELFTKGKTIFLKLVEENYSRRIATIRLENESLFMSRQYDKHRHKKSDSYGFNYRVLKMAKHVKYIDLRDEHNVYRIPIDFILSKGEFLFFKQKGFEKQIFVPIPDLKEFLVQY